MQHLRAVPATQPRAVLYLRQSVTRDDSISIELQEIAGRDHCLKQGYEVVAVEIDEGISGRTWAKRPAVQRVMDMVESKGADVIVLWKWSRLSRSRKDWALAADRVDVAGGRIESATEPIDTATASGRFARGVMTEYAAFQSEQIGEQWAEAKVRRFNMGLPPSGAYPFGWEPDGQKGIRQHPEDAKIVRAMYQMYFEGKGIAFIAQWLNDHGIKPRRSDAWVTRTVLSVLNSPVQAGYVVHKGEVREGAHDGIISEEEFAQFKDMRSTRRIDRVRPRESPYLLASLVVCTCGRKRPGTKGSRPGYQFYKCFAKIPHAGKMSVSAWRVDKPVSEWLKTLSVTAVDPGENTAKIDADTLAREIAALERRIAKLTEHLLDGIIPKPTYVETHAMITKKIEQLSITHAELATRARRGAHAYITGKETQLKNYDLLPLEGKQQLARTLIRRVELVDDQTGIIYPAWDGENGVVFGI